MRSPPALVVFGAGGQVGRALAEAGPPDGWVLRPFDRRGADITDPAALDRALAGLAGGVVVNAAAYTAVDRAESDPDAAFAVNRDGAALVAAAAARHGLALIHLSTDYVFDGDSAAPYREEDPTGPLSVYGASKLAGERAVRAAAERALIVRAAWLFSALAPNFVRTIVTLAATRQRISVVDDQIGCPTGADGLAAGLRAIAVRLRDAPAGDPGFGLVHLCGDAPVSWHGFAAAILDGLARRGRPVPALDAVSSDAWAAPARRPARSVLCCERLERVFGLRPPPWRPALDSCLDRLAPRTDTLPGRGA